MCIGVNLQQQQRRQPYIMCYHLHILCTHFANVKLKMNARNVHCDMYLRLNGLKYKKEMPDEGEW